MPLTGNKEPGLTIEIPEICLKDRVVYFPVRHHSPACSWHLNKVIDEIRPEVILIEGPSNANALIPLFDLEETKAPIAIYTTYVRPIRSGLPERYSAYYPFCDYSPEWVAIRAGRRVGAKVSFMDLSFPQMVHAEETPLEGQHRNLLEESYLRRSKLLQAACQRAGARDPDDLWDCLYETNFKEKSSERFLREVLTYCALARQDQPESAMVADGTIAREQAMAARIANETGKVLVVTGGFHTVALPTTKPVTPAEVETKPEHAIAVLIRYTFEQLDRLNGYGAGMPSPDFYQRLWEHASGVGTDVPNAEILVKLARQLREAKLPVSPADEIAAVAQTENLARLRGHAVASREDLLDAVRSVFVKGIDDVEGMATMAAARKILTGNRTGDVPPEAGQPPLVQHFRHLALLLRLDLDRVEGKEVVLDLYRKARDRGVSRFFFRLHFLEIPFANWVRGPDFVDGEDLERIQEVWSYHWTPATEAKLIERSVYGSNLEEASASRLLEAFREAEEQGGGRSAKLAAELVLHACRMGLHSHTSNLLDRTETLIQEDSQFTSIVGALQRLLILKVSQEPLEASNLEALPKLADTCYQRACYLLPMLSAVSDEELDDAVEAINGLSQAALSLGDAEARQELRWFGLRSLLDDLSCSPMIRGAVAGVLFSENQLEQKSLIEILRGYLSNAHRNLEMGPGYLTGLLKTGRSVLWLIPDLLRALQEFLEDVEEEDFIKMLPGLRMAFTVLTARECDRVAGKISEALGADLKQIRDVNSISSSDLLEGVEINARMEAILEKDGVEIL